MLLTSHQGELSATDHRVGIKVRYIEFLFKGFLYLFLINLYLPVGRHVGLVRPLVTEAAFEEQSYG